MYYALYKQGWWHLLLVASEKGLCRVRFLRSEEPRLLVKKYEEQYGAELTSNDRFFHAWRQAFNKYFSGTETEFDLPTDIDRGTFFQKKVWKSLSRLAYGTTTTYGRLADAIGHPKACRAVGNANSANPLPIVIPCHRVVAAGNKLGGYGAGAAIKKRLLDLEGVTF